MANSQFLQKRMQESSCRSNDRKWTAIGWRSEVDPFFPCHRAAIVIGSLRNHFIGLRNLDAPASRTAAKQHVAIHPKPSSTEAAHALGPAPIHQRMGVGAPSGVAQWES